MRTLLAPATSFHGQRFQSAPALHILFVMDTRTIRQKSGVFFWLGAFLLLGACAYAAYADHALSERVAALERQSALIASALQSADISPEARRSLEEFSKENEFPQSAQHEPLTEAVAKAAPAVVSIVITRDVPLLGVEYIDLFNGSSFWGGSGIRVPVYREVGTQSRQVGAGTGFFVREDGYIVTNKHVVDDADASYTVLLSSGEQKEAKVVFRDPAHDLALLKTETEGNASLLLSERAPELGQTVAAIGNALGEYNNTVSVGIVSGLERTIEATDGMEVETLSGLIQTDAPINRGNSGGPLIDLEGRAVGVNVAIDASGNNIGFAIPADAVREMLAQVF